MQIPARLHGHRLSLWLGTDEGCILSGTRHQAVLGRDLAARMGDARRRPLIFHLAIRCVDTGQAAMEGRSDGSAMTLIAVTDSFFIRTGMEVDGSAGREGYILPLNRFANHRQISFVFL